MGSLCAKKKSADDQQAPEASKPQAVGIKPREESDDKPTKAQMSKEAQKKVKMAFFTLFQAVDDGNEEEIVSLLEKEKEVMDVNTLDPKKKLGLLHFAIDKKKEAIVKALLKDLKADPNIKDGKGMTPLHHAVMAANMEILTALAEAKADTTIANAKGELPLDKATAEIKTLFGQ